MIPKLTPIADYLQAEKLLGKKEWCKIGHNTTLERFDNCIGIRYLASVIIEFQKGCNRYSSEGYRTSTTKARLNFYFPPGYRLYQEKWEWKIHKHGTGKNPIIFLDGIEFNFDSSKWEHKTKYLFSA